MTLRLTPEELTALTGIKTPGNQARWFERMFGVVPPYDRTGLVMTEKAFEALLAKRLGLINERVEAEAAKPEPVVRCKGKP